MQFWTKIWFWANSKPSKTITKQILSTLKQESKWGVLNWTNLKTKQTETKLGRF